MVIVNPLLDLAEFRQEGDSRYRHGGLVVRLGVGENTAFGWSSPVEVNFSETSEGQSTRGSIALNRFYVARQELTNEQLWYWTPTRGPAGRQAGSWNLESSRLNIPDDPDPAVVSFNTRPAVVSFFDSPGFPVSHFFRIAQAVERVCAVQNFRLWIAVHRNYSRGAFQAASDVLWHHCLSLQKTRSSWAVVRNQSLIGRGELRLSSPMWN